MVYDSPAIEVSVVIPCLNEAKTIGTCIQKALGAMSSHQVSGEVVIADNGSTDGSQAIAEGMGARVVSINRKGYGAALSGGMHAARGAFIIMGDADDSYDFSAIFPFILKFREGYDLVMGCRLPRGGGTIMPGAMPWKHRWVGVPILSGVGRLLFGCPVTDFHCGLRGLTREAFERIKLTTPGMEFASEMIIKATLMNLSITEIPITLHKDGRGRKPHIRSFRDGWRHLRFMVCYRIAVR